MSLLVSFTRWRIPSIGLTKSLQAGVANALDSTEGDLLGADGHDENLEKHGNSIPVDKIDEGGTHPPSGVLQASTK